MSSGRLRVYLGAAPGVGKTYAMLNEGARRQQRGTDMVIGLVETHGRVQTAQQIGELEQLPRRTISHRGTLLEELDLDAILARRPEVVIIDELAHTNAPGGTHSKRWEDVDQLLAAGIDVLTTVNVQHLESLNDVVESITGVRQRETVPDEFVRRADQIELVDMSPQALRRRMAHGNIYQADKVDAALSRFFREGNLAALRELALLWLADRVDEGLEDYRQSRGISASWPARERLVVGLTGGPESHELLRRAARIASRGAGGEWSAVYVSRRDGQSAVTPAQLAKQRAATEELGGSFHTVVGDEVGPAILDFARGVNASQIVLGVSRRSRMSRLLTPGVGAGVTDGADEIDVLIVKHAYTHGRSLPPRRRRPGRLSRPRRLIGWVLAVVAPLLVASALELTSGLQSLSTVSLLMMATVIGTAMVGGLGPALVGAAWSSLLLNYVFTPPTRTLTISDPDNAVALLTFLIVAVAVASVVDLAARRTSQARRARAEADALSVLSHSLLQAGDDLQLLLDQARVTFGTLGASVLIQDGSRWVATARSGEAPTRWREADTRVRIDERSVLALRGRALDASDRALLTAFAAHAAVIREREESTAQAAAARNLAEGNRIRTALLAAVSHDLRSPLAAIKAASSSLLHGDVDWSPDDRSALLETIDESADRLDALVGNLLDMSRLQAGAVNPLLRAFDIVELAQSVIAALPDSGRVDLAAEETTPLVRADPGLVERVLANLVENALKYSDPGSRVLVKTAPFTDGDATGVDIRVVDRGRGVPRSSQTTMFQPFQRLGDVPDGDGVGLGLAVARGLTEAMDGWIGAEDTPGGGLTMVVNLPGVVDSASPAVSMERELA